jgi:hypothetical protein
MGHTSFWAILMIENLLGSNINFIKKYVESLLDNTKEAGLEINVDKMLLYVDVSSPKYRTKTKHKNS